MGSVYSVLAENTRILKAFVRFDDKVKIYPFIIDKIVDSRDDNFSVYKQVSANGLAFAELGKVGYKLELTQDTLELEVEKDNTIVPTINYWLDKVFPSEKDASGNVTRWLTPWCYEVRTEYYESDRVAGKVYDEEYVNNWNVGSDGTLTAASYEPLREKARIISCKDSNKYNITQTIAETFELFCRYEYSCDERGSFVKTYTDSAGKVWTGRKVIFYNRAIKKDNPLIIEYKKNLNSISRESDSSEIYTKLYVSPIASEVMTDGYVSIANSAANPTMDEFILNFDYLHETRSISDYQYRQVEIYKANIRKINEVLADLSPQINDLEVEINDLKAEAAGYESQISSAEEQLATYQKLRDNALTNGVVQKGASNACSVIFSDVGAYRKATLNFEGIVASSINGYAKSDYVTKLFSASDLNIVSSEEVPSGNNIDLILDDTGFPCALATKRVFDSNIVYLELQYSPANKYKKVCENLWLEKQGAEAKLTSTNSKVAKLEEKLASLESSYNAKIKEKENINLAFENLMGPALREGYWTPEDYQDPRENFTENIAYSTSSSRVPITGEPVRNCFIFDAIPFENEQLAWTPDNSVADKKKYYKYFSLEGLGSELTREFQIHLTRHFIFTAKSGGETFVKGNYCILYDNIKYYFTLTTTYTVSKIEIYQRNGDKNQLSISITTTSGSNFSCPNNQTPLANAIDITSKFEGIGTYVGDYVLYENAGFTVAYMNVNGTVKPITLLNDNDIPYDSYTSAYLKMNNPERVIIFNNYATENTNKYELCYPRIFLGKDNILYDADTLTITKGSTFEKFTDYSVLLRDGKPYITLKNFTPYVYSANATYRVSYQVSRANEMLYLDAMQVAKDNSRPRYSYEVELANLPNQLKSIELGQLAYINDHLLGVHAASGYVDEIEYDLSMPKNDRISIKNYKTKFEDLFSTISAQSEAMKVNKVSYDTAASSFTPGGGLLGSVLQSAIAKENPYFDYSTCGVEITKDRGIILTNDKPYANGVFGQVALRGSGIFVSDSIDPITGRRVWNNAITAGGINASLITTGQLDTNLIRIFSGDQMTFQWNSEGLIAYKQDGITGVDINTFIRYSDKGLQYYKANVTDPIVSLDWNGLTLRNSKGEKTMYLEAETGNLNITGTFIMTGGKIGDNTITQISNTVSGYTTLQADYNGFKTETNKKFTNIDGSITTMNTSITSNGEKIEAQATKIEEIEGKVTTNTASLKVANDNIEAAVARITTNEGNISSQGTKLTQTADKVSAQATSITSLGNRVTQNESDITVANNNIALKVSTTDLTGGKVAAGAVKTSGISIKDNSISISSTGNISIASGGKFTIGSGNFSIDSSGNVTLTGKITATDGKIGGWNIGTDRLHAGSGTNYVALNTNASYPAIWAGAGVYSDAPFRVYQDGSVYITSLYVLDEAGTTPSKIDLRSNYWKMDSAYAHAVKTLSVADGVLTIALYNGTTVNFNKADLSGVSVGAGAGNVWVKDPDGKAVEGTSKPITAGGDNILLANFLSDTKRADVYFDLLMDGAVFRRAWVNVDVSDVYNAVTITSLSLGGEPTFTNNSIDFSLYAKASNGNAKTIQNLSFIVDEYLPSSITRTSYSSVNRTVTVKASNKHGGTGGSITETISASEIYDAGVSDTKSKMVLGITPGSNKTLGYGESQTVTAEILYNSTTLKKGSVTITAPPAVSVSSATVKEPSQLVSTHQVQFSVEVKLSNNTTTTYSNLKVDASDIFKAGKSATALAISPSTNTTLGYGESKTVTAQIKDGNTELKKTSVVITAPAKPTIVLGITPGSKTLNYGEAQTVTATVKENGVKVKEGSITITAPAAPPTVTGVSFGAPSLSGTSDLKFSVSVTYSDGTSQSFGEKSISGSASYDAGYNKADSLYTTVSIYKATTAHKIVRLSGTNIGNAVAVTNQTLWSKPNDPSSARTYHTIAYSSGVYRAGSAYTHYVANGISSNTTLYERQSATYYTKSTT